MLAWLVILFCPRLKKDWSEHAKLLNMPRLLELFCGTKSIGRAFEAAGWEVVSLDIVSKFEPTILCDIRSWDYALFPPGHFDMVWASPVCAEYSRALTMRRRSPGWRREDPSRR